MINSYYYKDFKIEILYEDSYIAILNKPSGLLTHKKNELLRKRWTPVPLIKNKGLAFF